MANHKFDRKEAFLKRWDQIPAAVQQAAIEQLDVNAQFLVDQIRPLVPVDYEDAEHGGELRDSLEWHRNNNDSGRVGVVVTEGLNQIGDPENRKGRANEFGRGGDNPMEARPHFFPTFRANKRKMANRVMAKARKEIRKFWGGGKQ